MSRTILTNCVSSKGLNLKTNGIISLEGGIFMSIGKRIRDLRKELGLTQNQFGKKLGIHGRQLARYEEGVNTPSIDVLMKIADYCEVSLDFLAYGVDKKLAKRSQIDDTELLDLIRRVDNLKKAQRDKIKWAIQGLLNNNNK
jgi:transcriptional regulator with XRE-family HTH domain